MTTRGFSRAGRLVVGVGVALLLGALLLLPQGLGVAPRGPALRTSPHPLAEPARSASVAPVAAFAAPVAPPVPPAPALAPAPLPVTGGRP